MKPSFLLSVVDNSLVSCMIPAASGGELILGTRVSVSRPLHLEPDAVIEAGEFGTIDHICRETGLIEILWDIYHRGLHRWDNHTVLVPFDCDDVSTGIVCMFAL